MQKLIFWVACLVVLALSLSPTEHLPQQIFSIWDKAQHALAFAGLMVLGLWAYPLRGKYLALGLLAYGLGIELAQAATGWRFGEAADLLADAVGVAAVWGLSLKFKRKANPTNEA
jgi:hypothetical protein